MSEDRIAALTVPAPTFTLAAPRADDASTPLPTVALPVALITKGVAVALPDAIVTVPRLTCTVLLPVAWAKTPLPTPVKGFPFSVNVTVPTFAVGLLVTVAVKLTAAPSAACGLADEASVVVVGWPVAGVMLRHQPPVALAGIVGPSPS